MRQHIIEATWRSQHMVEISDDCTDEELFEILDNLSNADLVGFTKSDVGQSLDGALNEILGDAE